MTTAVVRIRRRAAGQSQGRDNVGQGRPALRLTDILLESVVVTKGGHRVDRAKGIIYGVKILGRRSTNQHRHKDAARGSEYTPEAMRRGIPLYEGAAVNKNHPLLEDADRERNVDDALGWLEGVEYEDRGDPEEDGLYGDLHLLLADPATEKILEAAERRPELFGLSHNARGKGDVINGVYVIREITEVKSVDVVTDGATVTSLFESKERKIMAKPKKPAKKPLDAKKEKALTEARKLLEGAGYVMEEESPADAAPMGGDFRDHLFNAFKAVQDSDPETANKILAMLKIDDSEEEEGVEEEEEEDDEPTPESEEEPEDKDKKKAPQETVESRKPKKPAKGTTKLLESKVRKLCGLAGVSEPTAELLESLRKLPDEESVIDLLGQIKPQAQKTRSGSRGGKLLESKSGQVDTNSPEGFRSTLTGAAV